MGAGESLSRSPLRAVLYRAAFSPAPFISGPLIPGDPALVDLLDEGVSI